MPLKSHLKLNPVFYFSHLNHVSSPCLASPDGEDGVYFANCDAFRMVKLAPSANNFI